MIHIKKRLTHISIKYHKNLNFKNLLKVVLRKKHFLKILTFLKINYFFLFQYNTIYSLKNLIF